jgi:outer membrane protein OmpA-like peptidoglycan-associated protein
MSFSGLDGYGLRRHINGYLAYNQKLGTNWLLTPSIFTKGTNNGYQVDFNTDACYKNYIFGGLGYRTSVGLIARAGIQVQELFFIGYAYETPLSNIASYSSGSHEVVLGIRFCKKEPKNLAEIVELKKEDVADSVSNEIKNIEAEPIPAMDTVFITRVDTVYIESVVEEVAEVEQIKIQTKELIPVDKDILFEFDKAIVQKESFGALESIVNILNSNDAINISLKGHTDDQGPDAYNEKLSENRVSAVLDFLKANGIDSNRIVIEALGEKRPVADNKSLSGRKLNRRVEVRFLGQ